jgi:hypothetical protein
MNVPDPAFVDRFQTEADQTIAFVFDLGGSYRLDENSDIILLAKWHVYSSDFVDGLSPRGGQNEANDWMVSLNVGYRYTFN